MKRPDYTLVTIMQEDGGIVYDGWISSDRGDDTEAGKMVDAIIALGGDDYTITSELYRRVPE